MSDPVAEKRLAAEAAAELVRDGMRVGLGTGSTVAHLLVALVQSGPRATYVASSPATERAARELGLEVSPFDDLGPLDLAIDGADQVAGDFWLVKGGGGAHTREKVIAASAERFVVIVDSSKLVSSLRPPVPVEILAFGSTATMRRLAPATRRSAPASPDGGVLLDYQGEFDDPATLAARLSSTPGVVEHGLFAPQLVDDVLVGEGRSVRRLSLGEAP
ncbi:MAG TPA: ribose-5-phosphate isomerase RpiA [Acidimicrobiales bacterium]|nr:ribose-5-phosphate isomerase RpiA [Acidimicrobiales bacterium]